MSDLQAHDRAWPVASLGELCKLYQPETITQKDLIEDGLYPVYGANGVMGRYDRYNHEEPQLVIGCRGACGSLHITPPKSWITGNSMVVQPRDERVDLRFLRYFFEGPADIPAAITGAAQPQLTQASLKPIRVPLPLPGEQKRIVAVLDQAFAALDRARANAEASLADARGLQAQVIEDVLSDPELGEYQSCGRHIDLLSGFAFKSAGYSENEGDIRLVRGDNIIQGDFRWSGVMRWPESDRAAYWKYELAKGDVLVAMDRTWVSAGIKYAVVDEEAIPSLLVQRVARLRALPSLLPAYLAAWISSPLFERYVLSIQTGLGVPHVSGGQLENFEIRVPSLEEQSKVVSKLGEVLEGCRRLSVIYERKIADIAALRQSLLQAAFSGQLT